MTERKRNFINELGLGLREFWRRNEQKHFDEGDMTPEQSYYISLLSAVTEMTECTRAFTRIGEMAINFPIGEKNGDNARKKVEALAGKIAARGLIPSLEEIKEQSSRGPMVFFLEEGSKRLELE